MINRVAYLGIVLRGFCLRVGRAQRKGCRAGLRNTRGDRQCFVRDIRCLCYRFFHNRFGSIFHRRVLYPISYNRFRGCVILFRGGNARTLRFRNRQPVILIVLCGIAAFHIVRPAGTGGIGVAAFGLFAARPLIFAACIFVPTAHLLRQHQTVIFGCFIRLDRRRAVR